MSPSDRNQNWWRPGDGWYLQGTTGNRQANHYFKSYPRFRAAAQPGPGGIWRVPGAHRGTARRAVGVLPDGVFREGKCPGASEKIEINSKTSFFAPEPRFSAPGSHPKPPKPTRTQSKTQPHRGTGRGASQTHPECSLSTPGRLGVREKFGNRPGTGFSAPESSFRAPKPSETHQGRSENPASP